MKRQGSKGKFRHVLPGLVALGLVATILFAPRATASPQAPPTPHEVAGREQCLLCHGPDGVRPAPEDHAGRGNTTCLACHPAPAPTPAPARTPTPTQPPGEPCLTCHGWPGISLTLPSGEKLSLFVDRDTLAASIHGDRLACYDCHPRHTSYPHPPQQTATSREYTLAQYEVCKRCHFANYTKTLDSVHYRMLSQGNQEAPVCVDCHSAHDVAPPDEPRARTSQTCAACHEAIYDAYITSVHGKAMVEESNQDVPVCTDCHGVHNIHDPRTASFRLETPELCAKCHTNKPLMDKYNISTQVLQTYLRDFHGVSTLLRQKQTPDIHSYEAVCTDCHGVHNVRKVDSPESSVLKANLVGTCRQCHPDATENFPSAWLSHYEPSPQKAPLVYYVKLFYSIFIPFVVGGLCLHVLMDLWRAATNR